MKNITKDNKAITLIALIMTVILMLILASVTTYTGLNTYRNSRLNKFVTEMQLLQSKVDDLVTTKTNEELNSMDLDSVTTQEQENAISSAFNNGEVTTNDTNVYKVFTKKDILNILDVEDVENDIMVNFQTREIISSTGIEYKGTTYYTQYKLPNGQTIINNESTTSREIAFELLQSIDGLNCTITINEISINNGTLSYAETNSEGNKENWENITNYAEKDNRYTAIISKSGNYTFRIQDNTDDDNNFEKLIIITLTNKPKTSLSLEPYNYGGEDSNTWAYAEKDSVNYVWIPRFAYKIDTETSNTEIKFIKGNSNIATDNTYIDNTWTIHDKFTTSDEIELTGIWVSVDSVNQTGLDMITLLNDSNRTILIEI